MTLDEARAILGVDRGASHADVRDAFRIQARNLNPDSHPAASAAERTELARQFNRAREARDILLFLADRKAKPEPPEASPSSRPTSRPPADPPRGTSDDSSVPFERTLRFDEFVQVMDAAGFGPGKRSRRHWDIARIVAWSAVGILTVGVIALVTWVSLAG